MSQSTESGSSLIARGCACDPQAYMYNDDDFNWNHGISLAQTGNFKVCCAHHKLAARAARRKLNWRRARAHRPLKRHSS